jgi:hypothetical protein
MNLTEFTAELHAQADEASGVPLPVRKAGVQRRITAHRRRVAVTAAAVIGGIAIVGGIGPRLVPSPDAAPAAPAWKLDPVAFVPANGGDPLVASTVGEVGEADVTLRFTPDDLDFALVDTCRFRDGELPDQVITTEIWVDGRPTGRTGQCSLSTGASGGTGGPDATEPGLFQAGWIENGARAGKPLEIRIRAVDQQGVPYSDPTIQLGLGAYAAEAERVRLGGQWFRERFDDKGVHYRLDRNITAALTGGVKELQALIPAGKHPAVVVWGASVTGNVEAPGSTELRVDDAVVNRMSGRLDGFSIETLKDAAAHTVTLRAEQGDDRSGVQQATVTLAVYLPQ